MTAASPSPAHHDSPLECPTLADVIDSLTADQGLVAQRRQDLCSALRTLARTLGRRAEEIPAHPGHLRERLRMFTPAMAGLSQARWRNVLSLTRAGLKRAGLAQMPGRRCEPLAPRWSELLRYLNDRHSRLGLSRLASYASARGIDPMQVDDRFMEMFRDSLLNDSLVIKPIEVHRRACRLWNHAAAIIPCWPRMILTVPNHRDAYTLPWNDFPQSLRTEVQAYLDRLAGKDLLEELDFRPLRETSVKNREFQLRQFVSALVRRGYDSVSLRSLADLVAIKTTKDGLRFFLDRAGGQKKPQLHGIACMLKAIARHWVKVDAAHLDELRAICRRLDPGQTGLTERNRARLRQFDNPENVRALLKLPERLAASVGRTCRPTYAEALVIQTALVLEILLMVPMRIRNLASLDLERHVVRADKRGRRCVHLAIPGAEVKNGVDLEAELPPSAVALLDRYVERYRPRLLDGPSAWLFPGRDGRHKSEQALRGQITKCVAAKCGLRINPHLFRHLAAKFYLDDNPGAYGVIRLVAGHKSVETTTRHYCGLEGSAAIRHFDEHILRLRNGQPSGGRNNHRQRAAQAV